jgi:hypothetical protein
VVRVAEVLGKCWRSAGVFVLSILGVFWFHDIVAAGAPTNTWLLWDLLRLWFWQTVLSSACVCAGYRVLNTLDERTRPSSDRLALAFPVGLGVFGLGMYIAGMLGIFHWVTAIIWPIVLVATGAPCVYTAWKAHRLESDNTSATDTTTWFSTACLMAGGAGIGLIYLGLLSPFAVNYDASWMHLVIAQDYAREGRMLAFNGNWVKNVPHFASLIHTWGFLVPGMGKHQSLRWMLALHTEFCVFLWTLVGIRAAINWAVQRKVHSGWVVLFLFPAMFAHDSNMGGAADHVLALFAVPILMLGASAGNSFRWQSGVLWGSVAGVALLVKLQATYLIAPMAVWFLFAIVRNFVRSNAEQTRLRRLRSMIICGVVTLMASLLVFGAHAGRSWWYHNNPFYPLMQDVFLHSRPTIKGAATQVRYLFADWPYHPPVPLGERIIDSLKLLWSFSFAPHYSFQKNALITGSLFTLAVPFLVFLRPNRRVTLVAFAGIGATFCWAMTYRVDRNIQTYLPLLVVGTAAILTTAWQTGRAAKLGIALLVGMQLVAAGDTWFSGMDRVTASVALIRSTFNGSASSRYDGYASSYIEIGNSLPKQAVVLMHTQHVSLGINRTVILDWPGFQGQIDYSEMTSAYDVWRRFAELGVTHVVYPGWQYTSPIKQGYILFTVFSRIYADSAKNFGPLQMFEFPKTPPPVADPYLVGAIGVGGLQNGLYDIKALCQIETYPPHLIGAAQVREAMSTPEHLVKNATIVLVGHQDSEVVRPFLSTSFQPLSSTPGYTVWWRISQPVQDSK